MAVAGGCAEVRGVAADEAIAAPTAVNDSAAPIVVYTTWLLRTHHGRKMSSWIQRHLVAREWTAIGPILSRACWTDFTTAAVDRP